MGGRVGPGHCGESSKYLIKSRVGTFSVISLRGRVCEVVETLSLRKVDVCCIQETIFSGGTAAQSRARTQVQALLVCK